MTRRTLIAGNWKMNGSLAQVDRFAAALAESSDQSAPDMAVCVPFVYVARLAEALQKLPVAAGAQDVSSHAEPGAYTGEVSGDMLVDAGAQYAIVGHSERRAMHGEADDLVAAKANAAVAAGLIPIICIGESLAQREADETETVLAKQVDALVAGCSQSTMERAVLAYEPIWAIGTGRSATPEQAQSVHAAVRSHLAKWRQDIADAMPILYGGSVKPDNARSLADGVDVDGALVGGASLEAASFLGIVHAFAEA